MSELGKVRKKERKKERGLMLVFVLGSCISKKRFEVSHAKDEGEDWRTSVWTNDSLLVY